MSDVDGAIPQWIPLLWEYDLPRDMWILGRWHEGEVRDSRTWIARASLCGLDEIEREAVQSQVEAQFHVRLPERAFGDRQHEVGCFNGGRGAATALSGEEEICWCQGIER